MTVWFQQHNHSSAVPTQILQNYHSPVITLLKSISNNISAANNGEMKLENSLSCSTSSKLNVGNLCRKLGILAKFCQILQTSVFASQV